MPMCPSNSHDDGNHSSMPMCRLSNSDSKSQDDDRMPMCLSNSQHDDSMPPMCLWNSQHDDSMMMCLWNSQHDDSMPR